MERSIRFLKISIGILAFLAYSSLAVAEAPPTSNEDSPALALNKTPLVPLTRWAVFPFSVSDEKLKDAGEKAWWSTRETITSKKRFMVASKQYLLKQEVFQPRKELTKDNVQYLAQLLEADVVVTGYSEYRDFKLNIYLAQTGDLIWSKKLSFHPSLKASEQIVNLSERLISQALKEIPYQGLSVQAEDLGANQYAIDIGNNDSLKEGDEINLIHLFLPVNSSEPISGFDQLDSTILAHGKVIAVQKRRAIVQTGPVENIGPPFFAQVLKERGEGAYQDKLASELSVDTKFEGADPEGAVPHSRSTLVFGSVFSFLGLLLLIF